MVVQLFFQQWEEKNQDFSKECTTSPVFLVLSDGPRGLLRVVGFLGGAKLQRLLLHETTTSPFISLPSDLSYVRCWPSATYPGCSHCSVGPTFHFLIAGRTWLSGPCYVAGSFVTTLTFPTFFRFIAFVRSVVCHARWVPQPLLLFFWTPSSPGWVASPLSTTLL
jgi:hypothetical protein